MGACIVTGHRQDHCDAVCTELCFTIDAGYPFVALVVVAHVAILLDVAWRTPRHRRVE